MKSDVDVNAKNWLNATALHVAAIQTHANVVEQLLSHNRTDINVMMIGGFTPLHLAAGVRNEHIIEQLLDHLAVIINIFIYN